MNEKDILCGLTLLRKAICCVVQALDQELSLLKASGQGHLYWIKKVYRAFQERCSAHCEDGIILPPDGPCSPDNCKAHQLVFDGIERLSDGFRLWFTYEGPVPKYIFKRISFLVSFKEIPHLDRRGLHILKAALSW